MAMLEVKQVSAGYNNKPIITNASFELDRGEFGTILGSNGCGKTTLLKAILNLIPPLGGQVLFDGEDVATWTEKEFAQHAAYIPQAHTPPFPFTVADVVILGRTPYISKLSRVTDEDIKIAKAALKRLGIGHLADRKYTELSGGQRQLTIIARALAQETDLLIMDEPTASLDFGNEYMVLERMADLADEGRAVLMVTHNPNHTFYCANKVFVVSNGTVVRTGTPQEIVTSDTLSSLYGQGTKVGQATVPDGYSSQICLHVRNSC